MFIEAASLNRDGSLALLGLNDGTAGVFRVEDSARLAVLHPPGEKPATRWSVIRSVAYSPDGSLTLVGFPGRRVGVWSADGATAMAFLTAEAGERIVGSPGPRDSLVSAVQASADNRWIFGGAADFTATIWELETGRVALEATEHAEEALALFSHGDVFGWATTGGSVWRSRNGEAPTRALATGEHWAEVVFEGDRLLARCHDDMVTRWNLDGTRTVLRASGRSERIGWSSKACSLALERDRSFFPDGGKRLLVETSAGRTTIERDKQLVHASFSPDGQLLATEGFTDDVELWSLPGTWWSLRRGRRTHALPARGVGCVAFSGDGGLIAIGELGHGGGLYPREVLVYSTATGQLQRRLTGQNWQVSAVAFSPDGAVAALGDCVLVWVGDHVVQRVEVAQKHLSGLRFLPDGRLLVVDEGRVRLFRGTSEELAFGAPIAFQSRWHVDAAGAVFSVTLEDGHGVERFDLHQGRSLGASRPPIPRPERFPPREVFDALQGCTVAMVWRTPYGTFVHQGDGPRGWVEPVRASREGEVVVRTGQGAAVVDLQTGVVMQTLPFDGKLRASHVGNGQVVLVSQAGEVRVV